MVANIIIWSSMVLVVAIVAPRTIRDVFELWREFIPKTEKDSHKASHCPNNKIPHTP